jgi:hypothetical protein
LAYTPLDGNGMAYLAINGHGVKTIVWVDC